VVPAYILPLNNTFTGTNTFNDTLDVVISAVNTLSISSSSITLNPTTTITNQIGGASKITIDSMTTTNNNTGTLQHQIGGVNKIYITNTNITTNPTTTTDFQVNGTTMLQLTTSDLNVDANAGFTFIPTGTINTSVVSTVPNGFLYCDGTAVSRATYARLFTAISTTFGIGDGSTTFNTPNFLGAFLRGSSTQTVGGIAYTAAAVGTAQQDSMLEATTNSSTLQGYNNLSAGSGRQCIARTRIPTDTIDACSVLPVYPRQNTTEVRPFNYSVYYYIKY
jgi:microcystin-dependent protein